MSPGGCAAAAVVREGKALIGIPDPSRAYAGGRLEPAWLEVFYNPRMEFNRDISVVSLEAYRRGLAPTMDIVVVEPLTATGVRPVRYTLETGTAMVYAGDIDEAATCIADYNARLNGVSDKIEFRVGDARETILWARRRHGRPLHAVDLDPFGSPAPFLDVALANVSHRGLIAATATDLAVLEGSKPRAARRRYHALLVKTPESKEVAVRVLLGYIARVAAQHDRAIRPLLSFYADHYVRVAAYIERGARRADRMLESHLGYAYYCPGEGRTYMVEASCIDGAPPIPVGPLWTGPLNDADFIDAASLVPEEMTWLGTRERARRLLETLRGEAGLEGRLHVRVEQAARAARTSMPRRQALVEELSSLGYRAVTAHYSPTAIRTDAPFPVVIEAVRSLARSS